MLPNKLRNVAISLILDALAVSLILFLSARQNSGDILVVYLWTKLVTLIALSAGILILILRGFRVIDRDRNLLYTFLGTTNIILGLGGICFYLLGKINLVGLHDTMPNLFIGVVITADIFLFESLFRKRGTE